MAYQNLRFCRVPVRTYVQKSRVRWFKVGTRLNRKPGVGCLGLGFRVGYASIGTRVAKSPESRIAACEVENIRTLMEHNSGKFYVIARLGRNRDIGR